MSTPASYHPFYCEENVWHLCRQLTAIKTDVHAVFVTNAAGQVPTAWMRAADQVGGIVVWDYHVFATTSGTHVWDVDCVLGYPLQMDIYLQACFPPDLPEPYQPFFRPIPAKKFLADFTSDRRHMQRRDGSWIHPPPPWPTIGANRRGTQLADILNLHNPSWGPVLSRKAIAKRLPFLNPNQTK